MVGFNHGIEAQEINDGLGRPIQVAPSSVICVIGSAGKGPVNVPTLVTNLREGVAKFGSFAGDGFSIPEALDGLYDQIGASVIVINVCDPADAAFITAQAAAAYTFDALNKAKLAKPYVSLVAPATAAITGKLVVSAGGGNGIVTLPAGITSIGAVKSEDGLTTYTLTDEYTVASNVITFLAGEGPGPGGFVTVTYNSGALAAGTDYTVDADKGEVTRLPGGKIIAGATLNIGFSFVDPTKVTNTEVIGGVDGTTGNYTGVKAVLAAKSVTQLTPKILIAPRFTHTKADAATANPVVAELQTVARQVRAVIFADGPDTNDGDAVLYRGDWGSERIMVCDPWAKIEKPDAGHDGKRPPSIVFAGVQARVDKEIGFWASVSNQPINGIIGTTRPVDFVMGDATCRANYLNSLQVSTIIRETGYRTWGNRSTTADTSVSFLCVQRTKDMIIDAIASNHLWAVDRVINKNYLEELVEGVNAFLRYLQSIGAIYGGRAWIDLSLNTEATISAGEVYIDFDFTTPYPAEKVVFRAHMTTDYIEEVLNALTQPTV